LVERTFGWRSAFAQIAECLITRNEEMELLQARLLRREKLIPFPVSYNTNVDIHWSKNEQGRICVSFNGFARYTFKVCCLAVYQTVVLSDLP